MSPADTEEYRVRERPALRRIRGVVASDKGNKTIKVVVEYQTRHPKYGKYLKRRTVLHAHDETNDAKEGDTVEIAECRRLSKTKHHRLLRVVKPAPVKPFHLSAEDVSIVGRSPKAAVLRTAEDDQATSCAYVWYDHREYTWLLNAPPASPSIASFAPEALNAPHDLRLAVLYQDSFVPAFMFFDSWQVGAGKPRYLSAVWASTRSARVLWGAGVQILTAMVRTKGGLKDVIRWRAGHPEDPTQFATNTSQDWQAAKAPPPIVVDAADRATPIAIKSGAFEYLVDTYDEITQVVLVWPALLTGDWEATLTDVILNTAVVPGRSALTRPVVARILADARERLLFQPTQLRRKDQGR